MSSSLPKVNVFSNLLSQNGTHLCPISPASVRRSPSPPWRTPSPSAHFHRAPGCTPPHLRLQAPRGKTAADALLPGLTARRVPSATPREQKPDPERPYRK